MNDHREDVFKPRPVMNSSTSKLTHALFAEAGVARTISWSLRSSAERRFSLTA